MSDKKKKPLESIGNYFKEVRAELKKVVWPTYKQVQKNTIIVIIALVLVGVIISAFDLGFGFLSRYTFKNITTQQDVIDYDGQQGEDGANFDIEEYLNNLSPEEREAFELEMQEYQEQLEAGEVEDGHVHDEDDENDEHADEQ